MIYTVTYGSGVVNHTSNIDSIITYPNAWILELAKGVQIIEVGLQQPVNTKFCTGDLMNQMQIMC